MVLIDIVRSKKKELASSKRNFPLEEMKKMILAQLPPLDMAPVLKKGGVQLIAEVKRASPSKGVVCTSFDPAEIAKIYVKNGAAAISVLTESAYFYGSLEHLKNIRIAVNNRIPLLRKDFIFDPYQIYESRAYGADGLLLIVAILSSRKLSELLQLSHQLGMSCLVEVHDEAELEVALKSGASIIGINNRDLNTFTIDLKTTGRLRSLIPPDRIVVSESGIKSRADMEKLRQLGVDAVLIGEALMSASDMAAKIRELL
ncbi:MAG: indole-3-glycerol phosphate synthase TrpC [Chloroflexi bacterium]|nr:indole-3-glycerol phosphate synthase TrpC [Chloroflexota bacterium]